MDPRFLRTFVTVARLGSFSAAARELGYTQSAVSQHIAVLEADLGAVLLRAGRSSRPRRARGCSSTPSRSCCGSTPPAPTSRAWPPARPRAADRRDAAGGRVRGRARRAALAVTVRVGARDEIARAVAVGELDRGVVDGVAAPSDPLRLPETGDAGGGVHRGAAGGRRCPSITHSPALLYKWKYWSMHAGSTPRHLCSPPRTLRPRPRRRVPPRAAPTTGSRRAGCSRSSPRATASCCCRDASSRMGWRFPSPS